MSIFKIENGNELVLDKPLDYETARSHNVTIRATNLAGVSEKTFTIAVTDVAEAAAPTAIGLSASSVSEDAAIGTTVATISSDATGEAATYAITADQDGKFSINGSQLILAAPIDFETATQHQVEITATNSGDAHAETFTINVTDVAEDASAPTAIWADNEDGTANVYLSTEPDYGSTLTAEYSVDGGAAVTLADYSGGRAGLPFRSTTKLTGALGAGTYSLRARWVADGVAGPWSASTIRTVTDTPLATASNVAHRIAASNMSINLGGTYDVGQFADGEWYVVAPAGLAPSGSTPSPIKLARFETDNDVVGDRPDQNIQAADTFTVSTDDGTTVRADSINFSGATLPFNDSSEFNTYVQSQLVNNAGIFEISRDGTFRVFGFEARSSDYPATWTMTLGGTIGTHFGFTEGQVFTGGLRSGTTLNIDFRRTAMTSRDDGDSTDISRLYTYDGTTILPGDTLVVSSPGPEASPNSYVGYEMVLTVLSERPPAGSLRPTPYKSAIRSRKMLNRSHIDLSRVPRVTYTSLDTLAAMQDYRIAKLDTPALPLGQGSAGARHMYPIDQSNAYHGNQRGVFFTACGVVMSDTLPDEAERMKFAVSLIQREVDILGAVESAHALGENPNFYHWEAPAAFAGLLCGNHLMRSGSHYGAGPVGGDYMFYQGDAQVTHWSDHEATRGTGNTNFRDLDKATALGADVDAMAARSALSGTWTFTAADNTVTGTGGLALTELAAGDNIRTAAGYSYTVSSISDDNTFLISNNSVDASGGAVASEAGITIEKWADVQVWGDLLAPRVITFTPDDIAVEEPLLRDHLNLGVVNNGNGTLTVTVPANRYLTGGQSMNRGNVGTRSEVMLTDPRPYPAPTWTGSGDAPINWGQDVESAPWGEGETARTAYDGGTTAGNTYDDNPYAVGAGAQPLAANQWAAGWSDRDTFAAVRANPNAWDYIGTGPGGDITYNRLHWKQVAADALIIKAAAAEHTFQAPPNPGGLTAEQLLDASGREYMAFTEAWSDAVGLGDSGKGTGIREANMSLVDVNTNYHAILDGITPVVSLTPPSRFGRQMFSAVDTTVEALAITLLDLPHDGHAKITSVEVSLDGGATWPYTVAPDMSNPETTIATGAGSFDVRLRAVNAQGTGATSVSRPVTVAVASADLLDTFTRAAGSIFGSSPDEGLVGTTWGASGMVIDTMVSGGSVSIGSAASGGEHHLQQGGGSPNQNSYDSLQTDGTLSITYFTRVAPADAISVNRMGVLFRVVNDGNDNTGYYAHINGNDVAQTLWVFKQIGGADTLIGSAPVDVADDGTLTVTLSGNDITVTATPTGGTPTVIPYTAVAGDPEGTIVGPVLRKGRIGQISFG